MTPPIDAAEFDAHKDVATIITQFLCRNKDKGFSAREIAESTGVAEGDVANAMLKLGLADVAGRLTGKRITFSIDDVTINGTIYYRCRSLG